MKFGKKKDKDTSGDSKPEKKEKVKKEKDSKSSKKNKKEQGNSTSTTVVKKVFGGGLPIFGDEIPLVIQQTTEYLEHYGLNAAGIFRESGSLQQIQLYKSQYERGETPSFNPYEPHVVASLLKAYLRELKDPLLTFEHYDMFIACESINDEKVKVDVIKKVLKCLPEYNIKVIKFICQFLIKVTAHSDQNKMTPDTLSIVFLPTILRPKAETDQEILQYTVEDQKSTKTLMSTILLNYEEIFEDPFLLQPKSRQTRAQTEFASPSSSYSNKSGQISSSNSPLSTSPSSSLNSLSLESPYKSPPSTMNSNLTTNDSLSTSPQPVFEIPPIISNNTTTTTTTTTTTSSTPTPNSLNPPTNPFPPLPSLPNPQPFLQLHYQNNPNNNVNNIIHNLPLPPLPPKPNNVISTTPNNIANILPKPPSLVLPPKPIPKLPVDTRQRSNTTYA
ncbi:RhoGAP domain-containing protein [Tieghemostelium lacteum]|uniref:RhoGAP domain-containing protein n=1 Tax=Tieghemostelium lacteum TaxID=361077 RepID=A0A152A167_TIELA|nr:RhoGAP domain-containing protein [Tieghemostelium lacteum]|eukprot:KYQ99866.1 RhoGAP domain-containing protein [Tieghemostelium lacteum]